jgi:hypothetical protein
MNIGNIHYADPGGAQPVAHLLPPPLPYLGPSIMDGFRMYLYNLSTAILHLFIVSMHVLIALARLYLALAEVFLYLLPYLCVFFCVAWSALFAWILFRGGLDAAWEILCLVIAETVNEYQRALAATMTAVGW